MITCGRISVSKAELMDVSKNCACKMHIHARTADWNQTVYDP